MWKVTLKYNSFCILANNYKANLFAKYCSVQPMSQSDWDSSWSLSWIAHIGDRVLANYSTVDLKPMFCMRSNNKIFFMIRRSNNKIRGQRLWLVIEILLLHNKFQFYGTRSVIQFARRLGSLCGCMHKCYIIQDTITNILFFFLLTWCAVCIALRTLTSVCNFHHIQLLQELSTKTKTSKKR